MNIEQTKIAIIGLGYVGLPLAVEFGKQFVCKGLDIDAARINELNNGHDSTLEVNDEELLSAERLSFSVKLDDLSDCNVFIITVPTPIDKVKKPDLSPLIQASKSVARVLKKDDVVIYESTVYPGATEEICVPIIEAESGLIFNQDFFVGYSPERINPGDKAHRVTNILKVTSGSTPETTDFVDQLYRRIIHAGTHKASSIRVAEAAKVIENTQRDVNIALVNELALIFNRLGIDTEEILLAAGTKWNFLPFRPGLVGGHCIGVDPYYLTHKAQQIGYYPEIISAARRVNDDMGNYVISEVIKLMLKKRIHINESKILILGLSFKENCPDLRNTRVADMLEELKEYAAMVDVYDPWVDKQDALNQYAIELIDQPKQNYYDAIIITVAHKEFTQLGADKIHQFGKSKHILYDIKCVLKAGEVDGRL